MTRKLNGFLAAAVISLGLAGPIAVAQTAGGVSSAPAVVQPTDQQIEQYAAAAQQVALIAAAYQPKLESANTEEQRLQIMQEADEEMVAKVEEKGLTVEDYNGISLAVQRDAQLRELIEHRLSRMPSAQ